MRKNNSAHLAILLLLNLMFIWGCQEQDREEQVAEDGDVAGSITDTAHVHDQVALETILQTNTLQYGNQTSDAFKAAFDMVVDNYMQLQKALAENDPARANQFASEMLGSLRGTEENDLEGEAKAFWDEKKNILQEHLRMQRQMDDIQRMRENFMVISTAMIKAVQGFGSRSEAYVMYCPTLNDRKGAYWLSVSSEVRNPYADGELSSCGEVKKVFR